MTPDDVFSLCRPLPKAGVLDVHQNGPLVSVFIRNPKPGVSFVGFSVRPGMTTAEVRHWYRKLRRKYEP